MLLSIKRSRTSLRILYLVDKFPDAVSLIGSSVSYSCMEGPFMHPNGAMETKPPGSGVYTIVLCCTPFIFLFFSY